MTALVALSAIACSGNNVCVADDARAIDPLLIHDIEAAVTYWNDEGYDVRTVADGPGCDIRVRFNNNSDEMVSEYEAAYTDVGHGLMPVDRDVIIWTHLWDDVVKAGNASSVVAHEIGHQLVGELHSDDPTSVMYYISHQGNKDAVEAR